MQLDRRHVATGNEHPRPLPTAILNAAQNHMIRRLPAKSNMRNPTVFWQVKIFEFNNDAIVFARRQQSIVAVEMRQEARSAVAGRVDGVHVALNAVLVLARAARQLRHGRTVGRGRQATLAQLGVADCTVQLLGACETRRG